MVLDGKKLPTLEVYKSMMTVPDCVVKGKNKLGHGHGEAKFYIGSKHDMREFYGVTGFAAKCFMLKKDLLAYMTAIKNEYMAPSQEYTGKDSLAQEWETRFKMVCDLDDVVFFTIHDQTQITGPRGYINSGDKGYDLIREIALPLVSYIYAEKVGDPTNPLFYWKLFVDFDAINEKANGPLVFTYGKKKDGTLEVTPKSNKDEKRETESRYARVGQGKYREGLLEQCPFCPFTRIADDRLLIASHIKPWAASNDIEKVDPYNGYILSPMFDKLFDQGYITFTKDKHVILSNALSSYTWKLISIKNDEYLEFLPMDEKRVEYLKFHHEAVFKGSYVDE